MLVENVGGESKHLDNISIKNKDAMLGIYVTFSIKQNPEHFRGLDFFKKRFTRCVGKQRILCC